MLCATAQQRSKPEREGRIVKRRTWVTLAVILGVFLVMTRSKTAQWEEEVLLNTGETIWVEREVQYSIKGASGNPLDMAYRPNWTETLSFKWRSKNFRYVGSGRPLLLAVSPINQRLVLVEPKDTNDWNRARDYPCKKPFYTQLTNTAQDQEWVVTPNVESWLYHLPRNLMAHRGNLGEMRARYTAADRRGKDETMTIQAPSMARINPDYQP